MKTELKRSDISAEGQCFAIVVARWNDEYTSKLADGALEALLGAGATREDIDVFHVPGAFELPIASLTAAQSEKYHAVIALGVVIRGDTPHFDYVAGEASAGLMRASMETGVPVMFGVITADNVEQVIERTGEGADNKGFEAAISAIETARAISEIARKAETRFKVRKESYLNVA
ncbi:MAG: 6,7-dimethyl-8-ribityllumazine synthase [Pyrinomonadaceae bacterium]